MKHINLPDLLHKFELKLMLRALKHTNGNRTLAAGLLRLNRTTLVEKMKKHNILLSIPPSDPLKSQYTRGCLK